MSSLFKNIYLAPIGDILMTSNGKELTGLWNTTQKHPDQKNLKAQKEKPAIFVEIEKWLDAYFLGLNPPIKPLTLAMEGSNFQKIVWELLLKIPYGQLVTYGDIAKEIAKLMNKKNMSAQAVGGAVGRNPISIIVPCHRVIGANGNLTGYGGGLDIKIKLLQIEGIDVEKLHRPK